jgi:Zn finger protein HypA/HybF involved in hydrogenase expression
MEAYCLKCREKREMKNPNAITMKNGKPATEGICPVCGTRMFKIGKTDAHAS